MPVPEGKDLTAKQRDQMLSAGKDNRYG